MTRAHARLTTALAAIACVISCHSAPPPPPPAPPAPAPLPRSATPRSYAVLDSGAARITIFLATTRRYVQSDRAGDRYGPDDADSLQFAALTVNVPPYSARGTGELPRQSSLSSAFSSGPTASKEFFVASVIPADSNRFVQRIAADLAVTRSRNILVFVHGFNTSFEDAAVRAAQIAADLNFDGTVVLFSWPSAASVTSYVRDQQAARNAGFHLLRLLRGTLVAAQPDHVELLGHSMGSETIAKALSLAPVIDSLPRFDQVVFAAPDLDRRVFGREILPRLGTRATRVTLYASNDDDALRASRAVNGVWRLGLGGDSLVVIKGMDTIDATRVRADALGHTLFGNQAFLADLSSLLAEGKSPAERRLLAVKRGDLVFYRFRGDPR
ncbi:MAG TPA: alpha/beta hydrolase [Gemmatimonadaceae bacterium]|nr:alpha/beta hydrolase [Gemmatimonadaceae bacterium]